MTVSSNRHEGNLYGLLLPYGETERAEITVEIPPETAGLAAVQHTAWMLVNMLSRLVGIVDRFGLVCPDCIALTGNIIPLASRSLDLRSALLQGIAAVGGVPVLPDARFERRIVVGPQNVASAAMYVYGEGWSGGFSHNAISGSGDSSLPFGPYIAAALAASEVFKAARMRPGSYRPVTAVFYSAWRHVVTDRLDLAGPPDIGSLAIDMALAGVGAVGCTWIHALWATAGLYGRAVLADNDSKGVDATNLNRYPLYGQTSIGKSKASEAAYIAAECGISWEPYDGPLEEYGLLPPRVISAVDRNQARHAIQRLYPSRIISASTSDMRSEVLRCGPPGVGACLGCNNPPEPIPSDEAMRSQFREAKPQERERILRQTSISREEAQEWIETGTCGVASERLLPFLRQADEGPAQFAVGFTSVMAGTLLAAEAVKDLLPHTGALSDAAQRAVFQFWRPTSRSNGAVTWPRDPRCPLCTPETDASRIWQDRYYALTV